MAPFRPARFRSSRSPIAAIRPGATRRYLGLADTARTRASIWSPGGSAISPQQRHQGAHEAQVVDGRQAGIEHFVALIEMVEITHRVGGAGVAIAAGRDRRGRLDVLVVLNVEGMMPLAIETEARVCRIASKGIEATAPRIARGEG